MFRRAASLLDFSPRDGDQVEVRGPARRVRAARRPATGRREPAPGRAGRLVRAVPAAQGAAGGARACSTPARKRPLPLLPRGIGIVTSLGAAALHDVVTALAPARAARPGGAGAGGGAGRAGAGRTGARRCSRCTRWPSRHARRDPAGARRRLDRGPLGLQRRAAGAHHRAEPGAADQRRRPRNRLHHRRLLRRRARADAHRGGRARGRAAADLAGRAGACWTSGCSDARRRAPRRRRPAPRPGRGAAGPSLGAAWRSSSCASAAAAQRLRYAVLSRLQRWRRALQARAGASCRSGSGAALQRSAQRLERLALRLQLLDPRLVLQRGYALADRRGTGDAVTSVRADCTRAQALRAALADGEVDSSRRHASDAPREFVPRISARSHNQPDEKKPWNTSCPLCRTRSTRWRPQYSKETLEYHYGKHHNAYVVNLNNLQKGTEFENMTLEEIVKKSSRRHLQQRRPDLEPHLLLELHEARRRRRAHAARWPRRSTPSGAATRPSRKPS